jgi:hypothetical protein
LGDVLNQLIPHLGEGSAAPESSGSGPDIADPDSITITVLGNLLPGNNRKPKKARTPAAGTIIAIPRGSTIVSANSNTRANNTTEKEEPNGAKQVLCGVEHPLPAQTAGQGFRRIDRASPG